MAVSKKGLIVLFWPLNHGFGQGKWVWTFAECRLARSSINYNRKEIA